MKTKKKERKSEINALLPSLDLKGFEKCRFNNTGKLEFTGVFVFQMLENEVPDVMSFFFRVLFLKNLGMRMRNRWTERIRNPIVRQTERGSMQR